jgi:hypothetical protein
MDLQSKVNDTFAELVGEGYVDKIVKESLQKTIKDIVDKSLRNYSDFGQQLEKYINDGMVLNLKQLSLDHYNDVVLRVVQQELDGTVLESAQVAIRQRVQNVLGMLEKKEWKLSEIVAKLKEKVLGIYSTRDGQVGLEVEESTYGGWQIYLDEEATEDTGGFSSRRTNKPSYKYKYRLYLNKEGQVFSFLIDGKRPDYTRETTGRFEDFFFQLYAQGVTVVVDEDYCELDYSEQE